MLFKFTGTPENWSGLTHFQVTVTDDDDSEWEDTVYVQRGHVTANFPVEKIFSGSSMTLQTLSTSKNWWLSPNVVAESEGCPGPGLWYDFCTKNDGGSMTVATKCAGTLKVYYCPDGDEPLTVSGRNISYSDLEEDGYNIWDEPIYLQTVEVSAATTLTLSSDEWSDMYIRDILFWPSDGNRVNVTSTYAETCEDCDYTYLRGYVTGCGVYKSGSTVTLTAVPGNTAAFDHWESDDIELSNAQAYGSTLTFTVPDSVCSEYGAPSISINPVWGDANATYELAVMLPENGKVTATGYGSYKAGTKVTLKATTTEKGAVFQGWFDEDQVRVSTSASYSFTMPSRDVTYYPSFVLPSDDYLSVSFDESLSAQPGEDVNSRVGYCDSGSEATLKATGLPNGLSLVVEGNEIRVVGMVSAKAKTAAGWVTVAASNKTGYKQSAFFPYAIGDVDLPSADVEYAVGDYFDEACDAKSVSGLPTGAKYDSKNGYIGGTLTKAGVFTVKYTYKTGSETKTVLVTDPGSVYLTVTAAEGGTATGSGIYAAGASAKLTAKADKGYYFAGWYDEEDNPCYSLASEDYRKASDTLVVGRYSPTWLEARFVTAEEDADPSFELWDEDWYWEVDTNSKYADYSFGVSSATLPTVTAKNLPAGMKLMSDSGDYRIEVTDKSKLKPGVYTVQLSLKNLSGATATQELTIQVPNLRSDYIGVPDAFADMEPGVEIDTIPLYWYVQEDCLSTLAVSGLPKGLTFNKKEVPKCCEPNIPAYTITGTPTVPGTYTVYFTVKVDGKTETATSTMVVLPFPQLTVNLTDEAALAAGAKVSGSGGYMANSKVTLKATAPKNWVFAGWYADEAYETPFESASGDYRSATLTTTMPDEDIDLYARFIPKSEDTDIEISLMGGTAGDGDDIGDTWSLEEFEGISVDASSWTTEGLSGSYAGVTGVTGLPKGLTATKTGSSITAVTKTGTVAPGRYTLVFTAKNQSGVTATRTVEVVATIEPNEFLQGYGLNQSEEGYAFQVGIMSTQGLVDLSQLVYDLTEAGYTVSFTGLPSGLSLVKETWKEDGQTYTEYYLTGTPTKAGTSTVTMKVTGTVDGEKVNESGLFFLTVEALPSSVVGTFTGLVGPSDMEDDEDGVATGMFSCTVSATGAVSAKLTTASGTTSATAKGFWDRDEESGTYYAYLEAAGGKKWMSLQFAADAEWYGSTVSGTAGEDSGEEEESLGFIGWRNEHGKDGHFATDATAKANLAALVSLGTVYLKAEEVGDGEYEFEEGTAKSYDLKMVFSSKGTVTYSGKVAGIKVAGTATINADDEDASYMIFDLVVFSGKTASLHLAMGADVGDGVAELDCSATLLRD